MAKPNYSFQKRQKELAKKQKKEEKRLKKVGAKEDGEVNTDENAGATPEVNSSEGQAAPQAPGDEPKAP